MYYTYSDYLKNKYGEKVYKLPINLPITCPNRLNGKRGCSFCAECGTGFESLDAVYTVTEQLAKNQEHIAKKYKAKKYIAYFQNYTNTFLPLNDFRKYMEEAAQADRVIVMDDGNILLDDRPEEVFSHVEQMKAIGLDVPQVTELVYELRQQGIPLDSHIISEDAGVEAILQNMA